MLILAAAIAASTSLGGTSTTASPAAVQATATVRIISGVHIHFDESRSNELPKLRQAEIRTADGPQQAKLIEFE